MKFVLVTTSALLAAIATPAEAAYIINVQQVGADVVLTGSGSVDLSGLKFSIGSNTGAQVEGKTAIIAVGAFASASGYEGVTGPQAIGTGTFDKFAPIASGKAIGMYATVGTSATLYVATGYVSGSALGTSSGTFGSTSIAGLGLTEGTYVYRLGSAANADTFTINIGGATAAVPEPASWAMMIGGFGMIGATMRRRKPAVATSVRFA